MNKDLTVGNPDKVLWNFCLPLFGSIIFQQLYNIADSFVAGKFVGEDALAAVGNSYEVTLIFIAFAFGCNIGTSVVVSQLFGAKDYTKMKTAVYTSFISSAVLCLALMACGYFFCDALLGLIKTPENIFADSALYLDIYVFGLPFVFFYNISTGIFTALGDSKTPFIFLACSSTANVAMDILFVKCFSMGVAGVAWATFICQGISCVLAVIFVIKRLIAVKTSEKAPLFSAKLLGRIAVIAIPSIFQQSFVSVGNIVIQSFVNSFSSSVTAGYSAAIKLNNLIVTAMTTLANGISSFVAQNLGAEKYDRISKGCKAGLKIVYKLCIPFSLLYFFFGSHLVYIFLDNPTGLAMDTGVSFLRIVGPFYVIVATKLVCDSCMRGMGRMGEFMVATFTDLVLRVVLAGVLSSLMNSPNGIWMSWPIGWICGTALSAVFYIAAIRKLPKTDGVETPESDEAVAELEAETNAEAEAEAVDGINE